jgi:hypothetical protein
MRTDYCKGVRKTYGAILEALATYGVAASVIAGLPLLYLATMVIVYHKTSVAALLAGGSYSFLGALLVAWALACLCIWKVWPNGLTFSILLLKALGYWSLVSFTILLFYGVSRLPLEYTTYLFVMLMPEILLLLFTADVLRTVRARQFKALDTSTLAPGPTTLVSEI